MMLMKLLTIKIHFFVNHHRIHPISIHSQKYKVVVTHNFFCDMFYQQNNAFPHTKNYRFYPAAQEKPYLWWIASINFVYFLMTLHFPILCCHFSFTPFYQLPILKENGNSTPTLNRHSLWCDGNGVGKLNADFFHNVRAVECLLRSKTTEKDVVLYL